MTEDPKPRDPDMVAARRLLRQVAIVAFVDFLLLVALLWASLSDAEGAVSVLGPLHGFGFLLSVYLAARGAGDRHWRWWFPAAVLLTAGPPGALVGHRIVSRQLDQLDQRAGTAG